MPLETNGNKRYCYRKNVEIFKGKRLREEDSSQRVHDVKRHRIDVDATSHRRRYDVILASNAYWVVTIS